MCDHGPDECYRYHDFMRISARTRIPRMWSNLTHCFLLFYFFLLLMNRINSIYIAVNILCVNSLNTVLKVTELERNMFYRHKACLMYDSRAAIKAFTLAEIPFTFLSATVYVMLFYFIMVILCFVCATGDDLPFKYALLTFLLLVSCLVSVKPTPGISVCFKGKTRDPLDCTL